MESFEQKARDYYGEVVINKGLMGKAGFGARAIPVYVAEWIIGQFLEGDDLTEDGRSEIVSTVTRFLPQKADKTKWASEVESLPWLILTDGDRRVTAEGFALDELEAKLKTQAR